MCIFGKKASTPQTPAAAPPPSEPAADIKGNSPLDAGDGAAERAKRRGRNSLRIDASPSPSNGSGSTGLNIP